MIQMQKAVEVEFRSKRYQINQWVILINRFTYELLIKTIERGIAHLGEWKSKG
jgi:hypothetical protein